MALQKKFCIFGIIGCLCFGIGDWLLGYVDPTPAGETVLYFIRAGHGTGYNTLRIDITLAAAVLGIFFLYPAFVHIADIAKDKKTKSLLRYAFGLCSTGWIMLHLLVSFIVLAFSETAKSGGQELAVTLAEQFGGAGWIVEKCSILFAVASFVLLIIIVLHGKTRLKKSAVFFSPIVPMLIIIVISALLPQSAFTYGLYTFNMNAGMIVWFLYLLAAGRKRRQKMSAEITA